MSNIRCLAVLALLAAGAGCASAAPPSERLASSEAAIRSAKEVGANGVPAAALYLTVAQEELDKARAEIKDGDNKSAEMILSRAQADAELALALTRENAARNEAQEALNQVRALQQKTK